MTIRADNKIGGRALFGVSGNFQTGLNVGAALGGVFAGGQAKGVEKEVAKTERLAGRINAKRQARELRYQQGLQSVQMAAMGGMSSFGTNLFIAADDARKKEERIQNEYLQAEARINRNRSAIATTGEQIMDVAGVAGNIIGQRLTRKAILMR